jgi:Dickkopf N-terminal cysteine-rich region
MRQRAGESVSPVEVFMSKWMFTVGAAIILGGACDIKDRFSEFDCPQKVTSCRMVYTAFYGYQRACNSVCADQAVAFQQGGDGDDGADDESRAQERGDGEEMEPAAATPGAAPERNLGAAAAPDMTRYSAFDSPCVRDSQCGPGKCMGGNCYYGCQSDAQCGSGDRCAVESGVRICLPDPNPPVVCTRSAQCDDGFLCLNGGCRQSCTSTEQCTNLLDRCGSGVCLPDRRPLGECVVNSECDDGLVCLDGACVAACPAEEEGGVCLAELTPRGPSSPATELPAPSEPQTPGDGSEDTDSGEAGSSEPEAPETEEPDEPESEGTPPDAGAPISTIE